MIDLIWNYFQSGQISHSNWKNKIQDEKIKRNRNKATDLEDRLRELEKRHEQLKLVTLSLWSLLRDHSGLMDSDLRKYMEHLDMLDGQKDGRISAEKEIMACKGCDRKILSTSITCAFCGAHNVSSKVRNYG